MKILVIKQTSLGDVLHSTGHVRSIKQMYPDSKLIVMTATSSEQIYRFNPWVDELILIDRYGIKENWWRKPIWAFNEMRRALGDIRAHSFDLAFDLQGLFKSVIFLYGAKSKKKYVKGKWWGVTGFRNKQLHAIREMDGVLNVAGISTDNTSMELVTSETEQQAVSKLLEVINARKLPILLVSPFSRWETKDWPLQYYKKVIDEFDHQCQIVITGSPDRETDIDGLLSSSQKNQAVNLAGKLSLLEFVELVGRAKLMLTGDSFPMHVAGSKKVPVVAVFGPTDENKVGPLGLSDEVIRAPNCDKCDKQNCPRYCLKKLQPAAVTKAVRIKLSSIVLS